MKHTPALCEFVCVDYGSVSHKLSSTRIIVSPTKENEWKGKKEETFHFQNDYPESIRSNAYVDFLLLRLIIGLFCWPSTSTNKNVLEKAVRSPLYSDFTFSRYTWYSKTSLTGVLSFNIIFFILKNRHEGHSMLFSIPGSFLSRWNHFKDLKHRSLFYVNCLLVERFQMLRTTAHVLSLSLYSLTSLSTHSTK